MIFFVLLSLLIALCKASEPEWCDVPLNSHVCVAQVEFWENCTCLLRPKVPDRNRPGLIPYEKAQKKTKKGPDGEEPDEAEEILANATAPPFLIWGPFNYRPVFGSDLRSHVLQAGSRDLLDRAFPHAYLRVLDHPLLPVFDKTDFKEALGLVAVRADDGPRALASLKARAVHVNRTRRRLEDWCLSVERLGCNVNTGRQLSYDRNSSIYRFSYEIIRSFFERDKEGEPNVRVLAYSTVLVRFQMAKVKERICRMECRPSQEQSQRVCQRKCGEGFRNRHVSFTGRLKQSLQHIARGLVVANFRQRYADFVHSHPS